MTAPEAPCVAVGGVLTQDGRILLVRRGHGPAAGTWSVPGGRVELGESLHEALVREVAEETGLAVVVEGFLGWVERIGEPEGPTGRPSSHFVILDFALAALDRDATPVAGDDAAEVAWVSLDDLDDYRLAPGLRQFLADVGIVDSLA